MSTNAEPAQRSHCPQCNEPIRPGTAFCGNCGASVSEYTHVEPINGSNDSQATATFIPVKSEAQDAGFSAASEHSPWAPPGSGDYAPLTSTGSVTGTPTTETGNSPATESASTPSYSTPAASLQQPEGVRGMVLGTFAVLLIATVLALYIYDAWLSESAKSTVAGWLPWLN